MSLGVLRKVLSGQLRASLARGGARSMSSTGELIKVFTDDTTGVAVLEMNRDPITTLGLEKLTQLNSALDNLENDKKCRGVILSSTAKHVFCAGIDIRELYKPKEERLRAYLTGLQDMWLKLYGTRLMTIAAIQGNCPAVGCLQAMCCDYRVMAEGKYAIGLNETQVGIVVPTWMLNTLVNTIGQREAERALQGGLLYSPQQALHIGMIDQLIPADQVMEAAKKEMKKWLKIPDFARSLTKENLRGPTLEKLTSRKQEDLDSFVQFITQEKVQKTLGMFIAAMSKKSG